MSEDHVAGLTVPAAGHVDRDSGAAYGQAGTLARPRLGRFQRDQCRRRRDDLVAGLSGKFASVGRAAQAWVPASPARQHDSRGGDEGAIAGLDALDASAGPQAQPGGADAGAQSDAE